MTSDAAAAAAASTAAVTVPPLPLSPQLGRHNNKPPSAVLASSLTHAARVEKGTVLPNTATTNTTTGLGLPERRREGLVREEGEAVAVVAGEEGVEAPGVGRGSAVAVPAAVGGGGRGGEGGRLSSGGGRRGGREGGGGCGESDAAGRASGSEGRPTLPLQPLAGRCSLEGCGKVGEA